MYVELRGWGAGPLEKALFPFRRLTVFSAYGEFGAANGTYESFERRARLLDRSTTFISLNIAPPCCIYREPSTLEGRQSARRS